MLALEFQVTPDKQLIVSACFDWLNAIISRLLDQILIACAAYELSSGIDMSMYNKVYDKFSSELSKIVAEFCQVELNHHVDEFQKNGLVNVKGLLPIHLWDQLANETNQIIADFGIKRNLTLEQSDNTRRALTTVGNGPCREHGPCMSAIYDSPDFHGVLSKIAGERVSMFPDPVEQLAVSLLTEPGDTHGWLQAQTRRGDFFEMSILRLSLPKVEAVPE